MRGFINIDKPRGITSFEAVRRVRRAARTKKVGHAGTLDPNATGVLPIAIGEATRLVDELVGARKRYAAEITFGVETDTYDVEGDTVSEQDASAVTESRLREALTGFVGEQMQVPPAYSAVKRDGVPAYRAARRGDPLTLEARPVVTYALDVLGFDQTDPSRPVLHLDVRCGKGFYVRSLAHDLGVVLGVGAHLSGLRRTQVGPFLAETAIPLDEAVARLEAGDGASLLLPPDAVIGDWPAVTLTAEQAVRVRQGLDASLGSSGYVAIAGQRRVRAYAPGGTLLALLEPSTVLGAWHPFRVFPPEPAEPAPAIR
ncbi:MAG: tRNA pseudouridine(55) synthase TruB [Dehalococcoidia bacterium]|nr:MAG: tRNA pseudouridine(55) synthase TruB [Dehalococcoidia bacterium]